MKNKISIFVLFISLIWLREYQVALKLKAIYIYAVTLLVPAVLTFIRRVALPVSLDIPDLLRLRVIVLLILHIIRVFHISAILCCSGDRGT